MSDDLPMGWVKQGFTEFLDIEGGMQPPKSEFSETPKEGYIRLLQIRDFSSDAKAVYIKDSDKWRKCNEKDILIARYGASLGKILSGKSGAYNVALAKVKFSSKIIESRFVYYLLTSNYFQEPLASISRSAQNGFNKDDLERMELILPPINEQRRIVDKLERIGDRHRTARNELSHIPKLIARYKQAVLAAAFRGDLTADWRNHSLIFMSKWQIFKLGDICDMKAGDFVSASDIFSQFSVGLYPCFGGNGLRGYTKTYTHEGKFPLIGRQGALCGNVHLVKSKFHATEHAIVVSPLIDIDVDFLYYQLTFLNLNEYATGVAQPGLSVKNIKPILIHIPPLEEQKEIIRRVEKMFEKIDMMEQEYQKAAKLCDRLEQATLAKAFRGELVPQDPDDEPASVLLEQVKSQRSKGKKGK